MAKGTQRRVGKEQLNSAVLKVGIRERDERVLWALYRYKVLRGKHIRQLCYYDLSKFWAVRVQTNRLGQLVQAGFLERATERHSDTYYWLGQAGRRWLGEQGITVRPTSLALIHHDLMIAEVMCEILAEAERDGAKAEWLSEVEQSTGKRRWLAPDAVGIIQPAGMNGRIVFNLEVDRGTEPPKRFGDKVAGYARDLEEGDWRDRYTRRSYPPIFVVTGDNRDDEDRIARLMSEVRLRMKPEHQTAISWYFTSMTRLAGYVGVLNDAQQVGPLQAPVWSKLGESGMVRLNTWQGQAGLCYTYHITGEFAGESTNMRDISRWFKMIQR